MAHIDTNTLVHDMAELILASMTTQEMMRAKARPGFCFTDVAPMNEPADWREVPSLHGSHSDPNYGHGTIFGYDQADFLKRQYR